MMSRRTLPLLVAVETDPLRYHGEHPVRPTPCDAAEAEQLLAHVAADLARLFPAVHGLGLCGVGVLYDQAQLLRPGWPLFGAMADVARRRWKRHDDATGLLSIGTAEGYLPRDELSPDPALPPGILQLLPLQLHGAPALLEQLEEDMEHRFMEEGQLTPISARAIERAFGVATTHARFLTLTDLRAMHKMQLEHFGFGALWELLDAALEEEVAERAVQGSAGQRFRWRDGAVHAQFETFDAWASRGGGSALADDELAAGYLDWTREYRQILITLAAHGVTVLQHLPEDPAPLEALFLIEEAGPADTDATAITEHDGGDLGSLAVTVADGGRLRHFYPLAPEGSNALHAHIAELGIAHQGLSYPGRLCVNREKRRLSADCA
ncbi:MAG: hypothetical protein AAGH19_00220 [Pseudomonadota bacterium]